MSEEGSDKFITDSCSLDKIVSSVFELFEELELYGVPSLTGVKETDSQLCLNELTILLKSLVNASYHMLYRHRKVLREYEELEMKRMRDIDDNHVLKATVERFKRELDDKDGVICKRGEDLLRLMNNIALARGEIKHQTDECRKLRCQLKYVEKQSVHEIRKKDYEINKLQIQLDQMSGSRPTNKCKQHAPIKEVKSSKSNTEKEETYQQIICKFEANNKSLMLENEIMKRALHKLNSDLALLVADFDGIKHFLPNQEENEEMEKTIGTQEELLKSIQNLSLEEHIASSNTHVKFLNTFVDNLKRRYL